MPCHSFPVAGGVAIVCTGRQRRKRCSSAGCGNWSTALCDYPVTRKGKAASCDAELCDRCRQNQGEDRDFCIPHAKAARVGTNPEPTTDAPGVGECRVHIETGRPLYVVSSGEHGGTSHVTFSTTPPDADGRWTGRLQTVPLDKWNAKTRAP